jgi:predicted nucleic acid-binding protein
LTLYLDASVIVPLVAVERMSDAIQAWLTAQARPLCVGQLAVGEVGSAISRKRRMGELTDEQGERALIVLDEWLGIATTILDHQPADMIQATRLVRRPLPKLLMPDAVHLATCRRLGHRLVTNDKDLTDVADMLGIDWVRPA